ncbi:MAG: hypothetical protein M0008_08150 [Actinomycetota bacterium]|nr:hypothetical protein [Actinomycetota bacterium]
MLDAAHISYDGVCGGVSDDVVRIGTAQDHQEGLMKWVIDRLGYPDQPSVPPIVGTAMRNHPGVGLAGWRRVLVLT